MSNKQTKKEFETIWQTLSEEKHKAIFLEINKIAGNHLRSGKLILNTFNDWKLCIPFDKQTPPEYVYTEGIYAVDHTNNIQAQVSYIEVSHNADLFLDRRTEIITLIEEQKLNRNFVMEMPLTETNGIMPLDVLQEEVFQFTKTLTSDQLKSLITYNDVKDLYLLTKIANLEKQLNTKN